MSKYVLRMDDIGASSKIYNQHGKIWWNVCGINLPLAFFANWGPFKRIEPFRQWGPYKEITAPIWEEIFEVLRVNNSSLTVGVTACWAESETELIPFNEKFPNEFQILKKALKEGLIEIANHGLTHNVLEGNRFKPRMFSSNRKFHREFWEWLPDEYHEEHIRRSQKILREIFESEIVTFIPPGNVWAKKTEKFALDHGLKYLSSRDRIICLKDGKEFLNVVNAFHDREIVLFGVQWLKDKINCLNGEVKSIKDFTEKKEKLSSESN